MYLFRRQQRVADAAADVVALAEHEPVGRADGMAVDQGLGQARAGAAQADTVGFVEAAFVGAGRADVDARQALQGIGDVVRRQLADVFGGDHFHARIGFALGVQRLFHRTTDTGDRHGVQVGGGLGGLLCMRTEGDAADDGGRKQGLAGVHDVSPHHSIGCRRRCSITVAKTCAGWRRSPVRWRATYCVLRLR
ncbi:hypothetical protein G6F22_008324 [Rhizopus arrhizus]|nr:hypothetical protein G6F22_008324 [Rhizopus arrhizus]